MKYLFSIFSSLIRALDDIGRSSPGTAPPPAGAGSGFNTMLRRRFGILEEYVCVPTAPQEMIHPLGPPTTEGVTPSVGQDAMTKSQEVIRLDIERKRPQGGKWNRGWFGKGSELVRCICNNVPGRGGSQKLLRRDKFVDTMEAMKLPPPPPGKLLLGGKAEETGGVRIPQICSVFWTVHLKKKQVDLKHLLPRFWFCSLENSR